ncbi:Hypothetical predicted protein [Mytilus galloprovincialis]|uniref:Reverse transcriptase domain-containing protein n=1 Tax=Mytilus galloprovincialis TaxID=29158 RepID=A0A8B6BVH0_MYTGA|nr:Hypothetical predicted protein [Mytilus galloprovincialis]VDI37677.1 Hypothetical predicted protein [Mytilus galloprovincialis]
MYLDDGWICDDFQSCNSASVHLQNDLKHAGFHVNEEKSQWHPVQSLEWLGFTWNLLEGAIDIPVQKLENLRVKVHNLRFKYFATARELASVVGSIISMRFAYGPICQIFTRQLSMLIASKVFWDAKISLSAEAIDELHFWSQNIDSLSPRVISPWFRLPERIIYTDASDHAGAGILLDESSETFHCMWDDFNKAQSSTFRELKAVELLLKTMGSKLENKFVKLYSDNQNVIRIVQVGSMKSPLQCLAFSIFNTCLLFNIDLSVAWVPRLQNCTADFVSKFFDFDDWGIHQRIFRYFDKLWGPFTCDLFASSNNYKVAKYYSLFWTPGTSGVDAFAHNWALENSWIVPPVHLINRTIRYLIFCRAKGVLIVPKWISASYWPSIVDMNGKYLSCIVDYVEYKYPTNFFTPGSDKSSIFATQTFQSSVLVLRFDASSM